MKKLMCILLSLLLVQCLAACGLSGDATEPPENPGTQTSTELADPTADATDAPSSEAPTEPTEEVPTEQDESAAFGLMADPSNDLNLTIYAGQYYKEDPGEADAHYLEIRSYGDFLTMEHSLYMEDNLYAFWVEEFWPNADEVFTDLYDRRSGLSQTFSSMTTLETYDDTPKACAVAYTDAGIAIFRGGEPEYFLLADLPSLHTPEADLQSQLQSMTDGVPTAVPVGHWRGWSGQIFVYAELNADGSFFWLRKAASKPVEIYQGAWTVDVDNNIVILAERQGGGTQPYLTYVQWTYDAEDMGLSLQEQDVVLLPDAQGFVYLNKCTEDVCVPFFQDVALDHSGEAVG